MIAKINEIVIYVRSILQSFGSTYSAIYLALFGLAFFFLCFKSKDRSIKSYAAYMIGYVIFFFVPGCIPIVNAVLGVDLSSEAYMMFPVIIVLVLSFVTLVTYLKKDTETSGDKKKVVYKASAVFLLLIFVEASVPLQIDFTNFALPHSSGQYSSEVAEISEIVGENSVMLPSELQSQMKKLQWNMNIPLADTTDYDETTDAFGIAANAGITYVVIEEKKQLDVSNQDSLMMSASAYNYSYVTQVGEYLVFVLS